LTVCSVECSIPEIPSRPPTQTHRRTISFPKITTFQSILGRVPTNQTNATVSSTSTNPQTTRNNSQSSEPPTSSTSLAFYREPRSPRPDTPDPRTSSPPPISTPPLISPPMSRPMSPVARVSSTARHPSEDIVLPSLGCVSLPLTPISTTNRLSMISTNEIVLAPPWMRGVETRIEGGHRTRRWLPRRHRGPANEIRVQRDIQLTSQRGEDTEGWEEDSRWRTLVDLGAAYRPGRSRPADRDGES